MTYAFAGLLILQAVTMCAYFLRSMHHDQRIDRLLVLHQQERAQTTPDLAALITLVENLCQRVQAPEQAVIDHSTQTDVAPGPAAVNPELDQSYWDAHGPTKEELADAEFEREQVTVV